MLSGIVIDNDTHVGQRGNLRDRIAEYADMGQIGAGGQRIDGFDVIIVHNDLVDVLIACQTGDGQQLIIGAVNGHQRAILAKVRQGGNVVSGEIQRLDALQRSQRAEVKDLILGNIHIGQTQRNGQIGRASCRERV